MSLDRHPKEQVDGRPAVALRVPVRIIVLLVVLPVRLVWDALVVGARALDRSVLRPLARGAQWLGRVLFLIPLSWLYRVLLVPLGAGLLWAARAVLVWPWVVLWRYVVVPSLRYGLVAPLMWLWRTLLRPLWSWLYRVLLVPLGAGLLWAARAVLVWPWVVLPLTWLWRTLLLPMGRGTAWLLTLVGQGIAFVVRALLVRPLGWLYRVVLVPVGREIGSAFGVAWRIAGRISRAVGRLLAWLAWNVLGRPMRWTYRNLCTPVGHLLRDAVWAPARKAAVAARKTVREVLRATWETATRTRNDVLRVLRGAPRRPGHGELLEHQARTLGSTTTVPGAVPAPELSLRKQD